MGCMHGYSFACVFITIAAAMTLIGFGMLTNRWMTSQTVDEFTVKQPIFGGAFTMHVNTRVNVDVKMALTKACFLVTMSGKLSLDNVPNWLKGVARKMADQMMEGRPQSIHIHNCVEKSTKFTGPNAAKILHSLRHFKHIFISLVLGLMLLLAALMITLIKSPCTRNYKKRRFHLAAIILLLVAAIPLFTGVMIANREFHGDAEFFNLQVAHNKAKFLKMFSEESNDKSTTSSPQQSTRAAISLQNALLHQRKSRATQKLSRNAISRRVRRANPESHSASSSSVSLSSSSLSLPPGLSSSIISQSFSLNRHGRFRRSSVPTKNEQFQMVWDTTIGNLKTNMRKGFSFTVTFVGVILVFVSFAMACLEFYFSRKDIGEDNESGEAYVLTERVDTRLTIM